MISLADAELSTLQIADIEPPSVADTTFDARVAVNKECPLLGSQAEGLQSDQVVTVNDIVTAVATNCDSSYLATMGNTMVEESSSLTVVPNQYGMHTAGTMLKVTGESSGDSEKLYSHGANISDGSFDLARRWWCASIESFKPVEHHMLSVNLPARRHVWPSKEKSVAALTVTPNAFVLSQESWASGVSKAIKQTGFQNDSIWLSPEGAKPLNLESSSRIISGSSAFTIRAPDEILAIEIDPDNLHLKNGVFAMGQSLTMLGPGGLGKSRMALQLGVATILNRPFIGMEVGSNDLTWLFLQAENGIPRLQHDLLVQKESMSSQEWQRVSENLYIHTLEAPQDYNLSLRDSEVEAKLAALIGRIKPDVIVFDPLSAFAAGNLNSDVGMLATCKAIDRLTREAGSNASSVILHHTLTGKAGAAKATGFDRGSYGRGSKSLNFWTRGQMNIAPASPDSNELLIVSCGKNSNGREFDPIGVRLNPETMIYEVVHEFNLREWQRGGAELPPRKRKLTVADLGDLVRGEPMPKKELVQAILDRSDYGSSSAYTLIDDATGTSIKLDANKHYVPV